MTRAWRTGWRRSKGSMVTRSVATSWVSPSRVMRGASRPRYCSKAVGQSSSVPSSRPIRWVVPMAPLPSDEPRQVVGQLGPPGGPVVGDVVAPQVGLVADALLAQQPVEGPGRLERPGGVLPLALAADEQQRQLAPQPLQVIAVEVGHVAHGVVEVDGVAALAPAEALGVVDAALADGQGEQVGPAEGEVGGVEGAEAGPGDHDLQGALAVVVDERHDLVEDPVLEPGVLAGPGLQGEVGVAPAG